MTFSSIICTIKICYKIFLNISIFYFLLVICFLIYFLI